MKLSEAIDAIVRVLDENSLVIAIFGDISAELYKHGDSDRYFHLRGGMGLASSIGLGIAIARPEKKVFVLDGDGSLLMNLGTLATIAHYKPRNLYHIIINNKVLGSVGGYPTFTAFGLDLEKVIRGFGIKSVTTISDKHVLENYLRRIMNEDGPHEIVVEVEYEKSKGIGAATRLG